MKTERIFKMVTTITNENKEPRVELMAVTPLQAKYWLEYKNGYNRRVSAGHVKNLARDIKAGNWKVTHLGIAFDTQGQLIDGQHRLWAIVTADMPVELYVWFNASPESLKAVDRGRTRSVKDVLNISGAGYDVTDYKVAALRVMVGGVDGDADLTASEMSELLNVHGAALSFAMNHLPCVSSAIGINMSITRGVVARATYSVDQFNLMDFCRKLTTGIISDPGESVIVNIRQFLQTNRGNTQNKRWEKYAKFHRVLYAWLQGQNPSRLMPADYEIFPLPDEVNANAKTVCISGS